MSLWFNAFILNITGILPGATPEIPISPSYPPRTTTPPLFKPPGHTKFHRDILGLGATEMAQPNVDYDDVTYPSDNTLIDFSNSTFRTDGFEVLSDSITVPRGAHVHVGGGDAGLISFYVGNDCSFRFFSGVDAMVFMPTLGSQTNNHNYLWYGIQTLSVPDLPRFLKFFDS